MSKASHYSSHLSVLKDIYLDHPYHNVLEFGSGLYSTPYFCSICLSVTSIENQSRIWYDRVLKETKIPGSRSMSNLNLMYLPDKEAVNWFKQDGKNYDLIFIDGNPATRLEELYACINRTGIIVLHDIGKAGILKPEYTSVVLSGYKFYLGKGYPNTGVWIQDNNNNDNTGYR